MNFIEAVNSGKRFRPKGDITYFSKKEAVEGRLHWSMESLLGEWEVELSEVEGWVNVYKSKNYPFLIGDSYETKKEAELLGRDKDRIACIKIKFREGEGLSK